MLPLNNAFNMNRISDTDFYINHDKKFANYSSEHNSLDIKYSDDLNLQILKQIKAKPNSFVVFIGMVILLTYQIGDFVLRLL